MSMYIVLGYQYMACYRKLCYTYNKYSGVGSFISDSVVTLLSLLSLNSHWPVTAKILLVLSNSIYVTGFEKTWLPHNYKYLKIPTLINWREGKQMHICNSPQFYCFSLSTYTTAVEWIVSWITHHFRVFTGIANTTSTPIGKGGEPQSGGQRLCQH